MPASEIEEFVDGAVSATQTEIDERPRLSDILNRARRGEVARFICLDPDRLARKLLHQLLVVDELESAGVEVLFLQSDADRSTPDGALLFNVRGAVSQFEAAHIKRRLYGGKMARAKQSQVASGTCIYGYRLNRANKTWEEEPREAQVVRLMFEWATDAGGLQIARRLNEQGVPARFGGRWSQSSVGGILRNETYLGRMPQMGGVGHVRVPPLVSQVQFDRVQGAIRSRFNRPLGHGHHPYLLSGRLICGVCGRSMCGGYGRPRKDGIATYYGCTRKAKPADSGDRCPSRFWRSDTRKSVV